MTTQVSEDGSRRAGVASDEPLAVVGLGCRFPGAANPQAYWALLRNGGNAVREIPRERWNLEDYFDPDPSAPGKITTRWGGYLDRVDEFDPLFFGISPREATFMDPQQRLLLEVAWEALEDAGIRPSRLAGTPTGVFIGATTDDYGRMQGRHPDLIDVYSATGTLDCILANRISYVLDLRGPSMTLDTACSASLVAIHQAGVSLRTGECDVALAGGVQLILSPENSITQSRLGVLCADGRCKAFDARANGIVCGEGAGVVVLKRLADAQREGDRIYAVVRGSAVNQDGRSEGLAKPNPRAQEDVLRLAYRRAGISPGRVRFIEAHGTGTAVGDPIEVNALTSVLSEGRAPGSYCALGSAKTNLGHLEAAAGMAGFIKVCLALEHGEIPGNLHFESPNPEIDFARSPLRVQTRTGPWPDGTGSRVAGVSAFGIGGTNAHVVLESPPPVGVETRDEVAVLPAARLLVLSAPSAAALQSRARDLGTWLAHAPATVSIDDVCATAALRREPEAHRLAVTVTDARELSAALSSFANGDTPQGMSVRLAATSSRGPVFVFPGQGAQRAGMARTLYEREPIAREVIDRCERVFREHPCGSVLESLFSLAAETRLLHTEFVQPALFTVQAALVALWQSWGVRPAAVVGTSLGEVAAAYASGALTLEQAARVVARRSEGLATLREGGATAAVGLSEHEAHEAIRGFAGRITVAVCNGPASTLVAGPPEEIASLLRALESKGVFCRLLPIAGAGHSPQAEPVRTLLQKTLRGLSPGETTVPLYSTVTGEVLQGPALDAMYWGSNVREPVRFASTVASLVRDGFDTFIEISPHPTLVTSIHQGLEHLGKSGVVAGSLHREQRDDAAMRSSLGALWTAGMDVDFAGVFPGEHRVVSLPARAWERQRYWIETPPEGATPRAAGGHPLLDRHVRSARARDPRTWETIVGRRTHAWLYDHGLSGQAVFNSLAVVEMALAVAQREALTERACVTGIEYRAALTLPENGTRALQFITVPDDAGESFELYARAESDWTLHATGRLGRDDESRPEAVDLRQIAARCNVPLDARAFYDSLQRHGGELGPSFRALTQLARTTGEAYAEATAPASIRGSLRAFVFHPALFDACAQVLAVAAGATGVCVPLRIARVRVFGSPGNRVFSHARVTRAPSDGDPTLEGTVTVYGEDGDPLAEIQGAVLLPLAADTTRTSVTPTRVPEGTSARSRPEAVFEQLRSIVAGVLRLQPSRLDASTPLNSLGLDSMMAVQIRRRLEAELGVTLPVAAFLKRARLQDVAARVMELLDGGGGVSLGDPLIDDVILPGDIHADRPTVPGDPDGVLLTGATGFLGAFLLAELLAETTSTVHCLVRAPDAGRAMARVRANLEAYGLWDEARARRIVAVPGDLGSPRFGLDQSAWERLAERVGAIYHNGALVNFLYSYADARPTNVSGTLDVLRLATLRGTRPVHLVSTLATFCSPQFGGREVTESDTPDAGNVRPLNGYGQSKWVSEQLVLRARERGIPTVVYRPAFIAWQDGSGAFNPDDFVTRLLVASLDLGAAPDLDVAIPSAPVDHVARAVTYLSRRQESLGNVYHLVPDEPGSFREWLDALAHLGRPLERMDYVRWRARLAERHGSTDPLLALLPPEPSGGSVLELLNRASLPRFRSPATERALAPSGIRAPRADGTRLPALLAALARRGSMPR